MAIIPRFILDSVVALGEQIADNIFWIGTGFLVGRKEKDDDTRSTVYLITNKHVVKDKSHLQVRFNSNNNSVKDYTISLQNDTGKLYSEHRIADVIALNINPAVLINDDSIFNFIDLEKAALSINQMIETEVSEGNIVYALGFPMNHVEVNRKTPIVRMGCISRGANPLDSPMYFIIDAQVFPGNSGGPVINRPEILSISGTKSNSSANLIGIVSAYIPYQDKLQSVQSKKIVSIREENSGLTIVYPVDYIREVVESEYKRVSNSKSD